MAGDFDLSARMRFDGSQAVSGAGEVETALTDLAGAQRDVGRSGREMEAGSAAAATASARVGKAGREAATGAREAATANAEAGRSARDLAAAESALERELQKLRDRLDPAAKAARDNARDLDILSTAAARGRITQDEYNAALKRLNGTSERAAYGARNLGQQFGDLGAQVGGGTSIFRAFGQQAGQIGYALSEMEGRAGKVGAFLTGPWGIALTVAAAVAAPFVEKLFAGSEAADKAKASTIDFTDTLTARRGAVSDFSDAIEQLEKATRGLINTQALLADNTAAFAQSTATNLEAEIAKRDKIINGGGTKAFDPVSLIFGNPDDPRIKAARTERQQLINDLERVRAAGAQAQTAIEARRANEAADPKAAARGAIERERALLTERRNATLTRERSATGNIRFAGSGELEDLSEAEFQAKMTKLRQREDALSKEKEKRRGPSAETLKNRRDRLAEFGSDAGDRVASILSGFTDAPTQVVKVENAVRQLDDLIDDLARKKPPGFEATIASAREAEKVIRATVTKPYDDFLSDQREAYEVQQLQVRGRADEAEALKIIQGLQRQMGPLTAEQRDNVLATVQGLRAQQREIDTLREKNQAYVDAVADLRSTFEGIFTGGVAIKDLPKRLVSAFASLKGKVLFEKLLGETFRDLQDQANGTTVVRDASDRMGKAIDSVTGKSDALGDAFDRLAGRVGAAGNGAPASGASSISNGGAQVLDAAGRVIGSFPAPAAPGGSSQAQPGDIVVNGRPNRQRDPQAFFSDSIGKVSTGILKAFTDPDKAKRIGGALGQYAGKAIGGAATGQVVNSFLEPLGKALGFKTSKTGAQIGGAAGAFLPIPFGKEIGAVAGSIIGGLFKKNKFATAVVDSGSVSAGGSNSASRAKYALGAASGVADGVQQLVDALGGTLGDYRVSVGKYKDTFRVSGTGYSGKLGGSKSKNSREQITSYDSEEEAYAAALADAIRDGAVQGVSAAMQRALQANAGNADKAVAEALKVKEVETLIGGLGSTLKTTFDQFDSTAKARLDVAKKYGLDVAAVEKLNAEQRVKLVDDTLKARVGSLQDFLSSVKFGDLFEGSATDRRSAILAEIGKTKKGAEAGEDGAADKLQQLYTQLLGTSREAFGTAGPEFTSDRSDAVSEIERVIQFEKDRVAQAAGTQQDTTKAVNENNALTAVTNTKLDNLPAAIARELAAAGFGGGGGGRLVPTRMTALQ